MPAAPRAQRGSARRQALLHLLQTAPAPLRGADLAAQLGVSRQIVAQDIARLRAAGHPLLATPDGYLRAANAPQPYEAIFPVQHLGSSRPVLSLPAPAVLSSAWPMTGSCLFLLVTLCVSPLMRQ
jgi:biotin operon repressor